MVDVSPMILASALANLSPTGLASRDDRPLISLIDGGKQIVIANLPPWVAGELAVNWC